MFRCTSRARSAVRLVRSSSLLALAAFAVACGNGGDGGGGIPASTTVALEAAFDGAVFDRPVKLVQHPDDDDRWYVVEQGGAIVTFLASAPAATREVAVDLSTSVILGATTGGGEQGVLGLAFDPAFDAVTGGELYIAYTDEAADESILARYSSSDGGLRFTFEEVVLAIDHPRSNHNGGDLVFDRDGDFLFYSMGDGGGGGDPDENGQDTTTLLGTILRLDVRSLAPPGEDYAIPPGNPFEGNPTCRGGFGAVDCPEIWAWGLRNPWRMAVDPVTGDLWTGDVGQSAREEIDRILGDRNYGWDCVEGDRDFQFIPPCDTIVFEPPEAVHDRTEAGAITGGVVYRGSDIPSLRGFYVYGDFVTGRVWALDTTTTDPPEVLGLPLHSIAAFGQGRDGEVYLVTFSAPSIYRLVPAR